MLVILNISPNVNVTVLDKLLSTHIINIFMLFKSRIGLGTNRLGSDPTNDMKALNYALDIGYQVIDSAERYMNQASEKLIGKCLSTRQGFDRTSIQIITKAQPENSIIESCIGSLQRLKCNYIDFFLLHWRKEVNLESVINDMLELQHRGLIKHYGVSNFTVSDLIDWQQIEYQLLGKSSLVTNQIKYNFNDSTAANDIIPYHQKHNIITMAHTPLDKKGVLKSSELNQYASKFNITVGQAALHWILKTPNTIAIPKSTNLSHIKENLAVLGKL